LKKVIAVYVAKHGKLYDDVKSKSKLWHDHMVTTKEMDIFHIDYKIVPEDEQKKWDYSKFIAAECRIRGLDIHAGSIKDWWEKIHECISMEQKV